MNEEFKIEIVNPEQSFLSKDDVTEVVVPAFEGEMGILKDHISIISFLKPGIIKIFAKSGEENFYVEDGIVEFKNNNLSVLTSSIFNIKDVDKNKIIGLIDEWILWLEETKIKIMKMKDVEPTLGLQNSRPEGDGTEYVIEKDEDGNLYRRAIGSEERELIKDK